MVTFQMGGAEEQSDCPLWVICGHRPGPLLIEALARARAARVLGLRNYTSI